MNMMIGAPGIEPDGGGYRCTETQLDLHHGFANRSPAAWRAVRGWCEFHGIDPQRVPVPSAINRDIEHCRIWYARIVVDEHGKPVLNPSSGHGFKTEITSVQGEVPPLPFPPELWRTVEGIVEVRPS